MTVAMHILRKDVRRFAWWLAVWIATCVLAIARDHVIRALEPIVNGDVATPLRVLAIAVDAIAWTAPLMRTLLFVLLVPMVVHEDPLVDSRAFWLTRPIGGRRLFLGKLAFVVLLLVLPGVTTEVAELVVDGAHARQIALATPEIALEWSVWAAALFALSSLTASFPGLFVASARASALALCVIMLLSLPLFGRGPIVDVYREWVTVSDSSPSVDATRVIVVLCLAVALTMMVAGIQYLTRRTRLTWTAVTVSFACLVLVYMGWRWELVGVPAAAAFEGARNVVVQVDSIVMTSWDAASVPHSDKRRFAGTVRLRFDGVPPPLVAEVDLADGMLLLDAGTRVSIEMNRDELARAWNLSGVEALLDGARTANRPAEGIDGIPVVLTTSADLRTIDPIGRLSMRLWLRTSAYRVAAVLPLEMGARRVDDTTQTAIASFACTDDYCGVELEELRLRLLRSPDASLPSRFLPAPREDALYLLRNRKRGEVLWPISDPTDIGWPSMRRLQRSNPKLVFRATPGGDGRRVRIDDAWIADAEIVRIESQLGDIVRRRVEVDRFAVVTPPLPVRP